ncbi:MAG: hypothetical protein GKR97_06430 [Rhizobiaceae bacterium]|nr:hypothetical protein [Rhizobiaceae bacterium]
MKRFGLVLLCAFANLLVSHGVQADDDCGQSTACTIKGLDGGTYYVASTVATNVAKPLKAFIFFHGHNGSGAAIMRNKGLKKALQEAGYLLVAYSVEKLI